ncbi:MAG TPA: DUF4335 domain-containing protein [Leptolyngbyaceae cyanobacterium M33_DOE_097]|uniref:DUF4335 domain-containing protein n=1 Tax=Oscillatoriales cyanobacterium SpSt-418 TaxID=2282169 RepID=A0A7C3KGV2_9CYAN|nr:DUF4335 domain-containing protein [Leptolyngbyaceae cyanobacterium M33_DOE_097]
MTIQRQYSLPSCTLKLEGLGENKISNAAEARPLLLVLLNAYCHIAGQEPPISGGREFLESLVSEVSQYAQSFLSGVTPAVKAKEESPVRIAPIDGSRHRLTILGSNESKGTERSLDLSTVQLFDLVEAIDQMLADRQTLPNLVLDLQPLSRRYAKRGGGESSAQRSIPALLGVSGLTAAALVFAMLPNPKVQQPRCLFPSPECLAEGAKDDKTASPSPSPSPNAATSPTPTTSPSPQAVASPETPEASPSPQAPGTAPAITDAAQLTSLGGQLQSALAGSWKGGNTKNNLIYRVSVSEDGTVRGYDFGNDGALTNLKLTPLPGLLKPLGEDAGSQPLGDFRVVFTPTGQVEVEPWKQVAAAPSINENPEITDAEQLEELLPKVRSQIFAAWTGDRTRFVKPLEFQVRVKPDGTIETYRPYNQPAFDYEKDTPLPKIAQRAGNELAPTQQPHALFKVVFNEKGQVELSPWRGWKN